MYNRYIRNDNGVYTRIPQDDQPPHHDTSQNPNPQQTPSSAQSRPQAVPPPPRAFSDSAARESTHEPDGLTGFLRHFLDQFHLDHVDTGDLLLLGLLFFLFREEADEELLVALGLLLIL